MNTTSRRRFLGGAAAGLAALTLPRFLVGCATRGVTPAVPAPGDPFLAELGIDDTLLARVMRELTSGGADIADIYIQHARYNGLTLEDGIVSKATSRVDLGVGLRVVVGDQTGYAFTEDLDPESLTRAARTAASIARGGQPRDPVEVFKEQVHPKHHTLAVPLSQVPVGDKLPLLQRIEAKARGADPAIDKVVVQWSDDEEHVVVVDHHGRTHKTTRPMTRVWCIPTAKKGEETQSNSANLAGRRGFDHYTEEELDGLVKEAVDKTMILFEARRPPAGELPVVLAAGASGILLHEAIGHGMEADFNRKGISIFSDMVGRKVAEDFVTIVDSGILENHRGSLDFDDEGNSVERTVLVENGVMKGYLHDGISARHYGVAPTGNGRRQSFRHPPVPRMRCTYMEGGPHSRDEIISSLDTGIVAETFTNGQVVIGAGDFTFYIKNGWLVEGGRITAPIKDCNIIGNGPDVLSKMTMAAGDMEMDKGGWTCGKAGQGVPVSLGMPTVLVSSITVGGENA